MDDVRFCLHITVHNSVTIVSKEYAEFFTSGDPGSEPLSLDPDPNLKEMKMVQAQPTCIDSTGISDIS